LGSNSGFGLSRISANGGTPEKSDMSQRFHRSNLGRRLKKLEVELADEAGLVSHSAQWRANWLDWMQRLANGENPPGKMAEEAFRTLQDEVVIPPHKHDDE
jgi:hypothetical protein